MKKKLVAVVLMIACLMTQEKFVFAKSESADDVLLATGMTLAEIDAMDPDIKEYIAANLPKSSRYIETYSAELPSELQASGTNLATLTCPMFEVWNSLGHNIKAFPTYETKMVIRPKGHDMFVIGVGTGMNIAPGQFSGTIWCMDMDAANPTWVKNGSLATTEEAIEYIAVGGLQLGTPSYAMKFKGCCSTIIRQSNPNATRMVALKYSYDRTGTVSYNVGISAGFISLGLSAGAQANVQIASATFDVPTLS